MFQINQKVRITDSSVPTKDGKTGTVDQIDAWDGPRVFVKLDEPVEDHRGGVWSTHYRTRNAQDDLVVLDGLQPEAAPEVDEPVNTAQPEAAPEVSDFDFSVPGWAMLLSDIGNDKMMAFLHALTWAYPDIRWASSHLPNGVHTGGHLAPLFDGGFDYSGVRYNPDFVLLENRTYASSVPLSQVEKLIAKHAEYLRQSAEPEVEVADTASSDAPETAEPKDAGEIAYEDMVAELSEAKPIMLEGSHVILSEAKPIMLEGSHVILSTEQYEVLIAQKHEIDRLTAIADILYGKMSQIERIFLS